MIKNYSQRTIKIISLVIYFIIIILPIGGCDISNLPYPKNPAQPPGYMFGLIWSVLYICMFISFYLIINGDDGYIKYLAITSAIIGLLLNKSWVILWCDNKPKQAFILFIFYLMVITIQMMSAYSIDKMAGILIAPLLAWAIVAISFNKWIVEQIG